MKKRILLLSALMCGFVFNVFAQSQEEIEQMQKEKSEKEAAAAELKGQLDALNGEIASIQSTLDGLDKWKTGASGLIGADINRFNNWAQKADLNSAGTSITFNYSGFANYIEDNYFWRNNGAINLGWLKYDENSKIDEPGENNDLNEVADVVNIQSMFGYNVYENLAVTALGEFRSSLLSNFNNPGYLDLGAGVSYTPMPNLIIVAIPLNYNFIFAKSDTDYTSSMGAKVVVDYNQKIADLINWRSNLSAFLSYSGSDLSNYTWINGISFNAYKGIGVGFELGLRWNPQETAARELGSGNQSYYALGLTFNL